MLIGITVSKVCETFQRSTDVTSRVLAPVSITNKRYRVECMSIWLTTAALIVNGTKTCEIIDNNYANGLTSSQHNAYNTCCVTWPDKGSLSNRQQRGNHTGHGTDTYNPITKLQDDLMNIHHLIDNDYVHLLILAATLRGSRPGVQSASVIMTSLMTP